MKRTWPLTSFDTFCLGMNIKSAWLYDKVPDFDKMKSALAKIASMYPHLDGRYNEETKSVIWDDGSKPELPFDTLDIRGYSVSQLSGNASLAWSLVKPYDVKGFKKGLAPAFSATLGYLKDGCILYIQAAHATMDAHAFYSLADQWAALYRGEEVSAMTVDQSLIPAEDAYSKEETIRLVQQKGWAMMNFKKVIKMLVGLVRNNSIKKTTVIEVSQEEISEMKAASGAGANACLAAVTVRKMAERLPEKKSFKLLFTADLRGRVTGIGEDFFGNISQPVVLGNEVDVENDVVSAAVQIGKQLKDVMASGEVEENIRLSQCSANYSLPYVPFDASDMNCPGNGTIYINNFLKFRANELDWGLGLPSYTFANELTDMVKFWQPAAGGPVQIIFGGYAAKLMK